ASGDALLRKPTTGTACCPRAPSGHAAAAPPSSVINSRRLRTIALVVEPSCAGLTRASIFLRRRMDCRVTSAFTRVFRRAMPGNDDVARRLVCRESSIVRGDGGSVMTVSPSRPEARSRFGSQTANELGAPVASSIPEQLPGREPASARKGYEDGNALFRW